MGIPERSMRTAKSARVTRLPSETTQARASTRLGSVQSMEVWYRTGGPGSPRDARGTLDLLREHGRVSVRTLGRARGPAPATTREGFSVDLKPAPRLTTAGNPSGTFPEGGCAGEK